MQSWIMGRLAIVSVLTVSLGLMMACTSASGSMSPEEFYRGKVITVLTSETGSGTELNTRTIAPYLAKETGATVKVENMASDELGNHTYVQAKRDGLTLFTNSTPAVIANDILQSPGVLYEVEKFNFVADIYPSEIKAMHVSPKFPHNTLEEMRKVSGLKGGGTSVKGTYVTTVAVTFELLGLNGKVISGFKGTSNLRLALTRGEIDILVASDDSAQKEEADGNLKNFLIVGGERSRVLPNVPTMFELGVKVPKELESSYNFARTTGHAAALPPDVPQDRVEYFRKTFQRMSDNKDVQAELEKANSAHQRPFMSGKALQERINGLKADKGLADRLDAILAKYVAVQ